MAEIDALKYELKEERKAFERLHKKHLELLKQQGELEKENEELKKELDSFNPVVFNDVCKGTVILYSKGEVE